MTRNPIRWLRQTSGIPWRKRLRHHINLVRWTLDCCDGCGHRFAWKGDARFGMNSQTFHEPCLQARMWRSKADDRLRVVGIMADLTGLTGSDVRETMSLRALNGQPGSGSSEWDVAWRVFYDLDTRPIPPGSSDAF